MLHDLNNTDKHKLVPLVLLTAATSRIRFPSGRSDIVMTFFPREPLKDGTKLYFLPALDPAMEVEPELHCSVAFEKIGGCEFEAVIPFLTKTITYVSRIVDSFVGEF
jgi:hypothetical protein